MSGIIAIVAVIGLLYFVGVCVTVAAMNESVNL